MGPITVFDKSFLQMLSMDEAVWFDHFFYPVITPLFLAETLADLEKTPRRDKTAEDEVAIIAAKTPEMSGAPCHFHLTLAVNNLLGLMVPMNGRIPIAGTRQVVRDGKLGAIIEEPPEVKALYRWQNGRFHDVERMFAKDWRARIARIDLAAIEASVRRAGINPKTCKNSAQALRYADEILASSNVSASRFQSFLTILNIPPHLGRIIKLRWNEAARPPITTFAPYAAHVLRVELFFQICVGANIIASTRASHQIDITYLAYLPFCNVFISSDKLHRTFVPLFLRDDQSFAWGEEIKAGLKAIDGHYKSLPDSIKETGIYKFARSIPETCVGTTREIFSKHAPRLLSNSSEIILSTERNETLVNHINEWDVAPEAPTIQPSKEVEAMIVKRSIHGQRGSWIQVAQGDREKKPG